MTPFAKLFCGITLITIPSIIYGGYFLLTVRTGTTKAQLTDFQKGMFRAGHAHAGVLVILSLVTQLLIDYSGAGKSMEIILRIAFPLAAILISGGFFAAAAGKQLTKPTSGIWILYIGVIVLAIAVVVLGIDLISNS